MAQDKYVIKAVEATYTDFFSPMINFSNSGVILIENIDTWQSQSAYIKFPIERLKNISMSKIYLQIHVNKFKVDAILLNGVNINIKTMEGISFKSLTWNNRPTIDVAKDMAIKDNRFLVKEKILSEKIRSNDGFINIEVTDMVKNLIGKRDNVKFQIYEVGVSGAISISSVGTKYGLLYEPKLVIS